MRNRDIDGDADHVLFVLGSWEIHALFEESEWVEIFHHCKKHDPIDDRVEYAYQLPGDTACPGCNAIQPDEIPALEQMHNMDRPPRRWGQSLMEQMKEDYQKMYVKMKRELDGMCLKGNGVNE